MVANDPLGGPPVDRNLNGYSDADLVATWRGRAKALQKERVRYAQSYLRAKIRKESDGTAHQIATEETGASITLFEEDIAIVRAIWYARGRKETP